jgi:hypothetical protein
MKRKRKKSDTYSNPTKKRKQKFGKKDRLKINPRDFRD